MARLTREDIRGLEDLKVVDFKVPEWDNKVVGLRALSGVQRQQLHLKRKQSEKDPIGFLSTLAAMSIVDDDGELVFNVNDKEHLKILNDRNSAALGGIAARVTELNKMGEKYVKQAVKNLPKTGNSNSGTDSLPDLDTPSMTSKGA